MKMLIIGKWEGSECGKSFEIYNPLNGEIIDTVPKGNTEDVKKQLKLQLKVKK